MFPRFSGRATTPMIRFGHHRRYSPERTWEPLSDDEWSVLSPFLHRAAEAGAETKREAEFAAAQHPDAPAICQRAADIPHFWALKIPHIGWSS